MTTNIGPGDHVPFQIILGQLGNTISTDVTSVYTTTLGVDSIGRVTLQPNHEYYLSAKFQSVQFSTSLGSVFYQWTNADNGSGIGTVGHTVGSIGLNGNNATEIIGFTTTTVATRLEVRITSASSLLSIDNVILFVQQMS